MLLPGSERANQNPLAIRVEYSVFSKSVSFYKGTRTPAPSRGRSDTLSSDEDMFSVLKTIIHYNKIPQKVTGARVRVLRQGAGPPEPLHPRAALVTSRGRAVHAPPPMLVRSVRSVLVL